MKYSFFGINDIDKIIGESKYISNIKTVILSIIKNPSSVLLCGSKGTGKKLIAKTIYALSKNEDENSCFCEINCNENSYFSIKDFNFDLCNMPAFIQKKTIYIENVDSLNLDFQKALSNLIKSVSTNIRFIFSTESDLENLVESGKFDSELFFLISSVTINTLSLQMYSEDIPLIFNYYFEKYNSISNKKVELVSEIIKEKMISNFWNGNVEELKITIKKAFLSSTNNLLTLKDFGFNEVNKNCLTDLAENQISAINYNNENYDYSLKNALDSFKKDYVTKILQENNWNQTKTAKILGIQRTYVIKLINDLNIKKL